MGRDNAMLLCFGDEGVLHFARFSDWHPSEKVEVSEQDAPFFLGLREELRYRWKRKEHIIPLLGRPRMIGKRRVVVEEENGNGDGNGAGAEDHFRVEYHPVIEFRLKNFTDKNKFSQAIRSLGGRDREIFGIYPDSSSKFSYEERFYWDKRMEWYGAYEIDLGKEIEPTPDKKHSVRELLAMRPIKDRSSKIGVLVFDIETDVTTGHTVCVAVEGLREGEPVEKIFHCVPDRHQPMSVDEYRRRYIDENVRFSKEVKMYRLSDPKVLDIAPDRRSMLSRFAEYVGEAVHDWCDVLAGFNNKSYDQRQLRKEINLLNATRKEGEPEIKFVGKGGYPMTPLPVTDVGVEFRSIGTANLDVYRDVSKGRGMPLPSARKDLRKVERFRKLTRPKKDFSGLNTYLAVINPEYVPPMLGHSIEDVRNTLTVAYGHIHERMTGRLVGVGRVS